MKFISPLQLIIGFKRKLILNLNQYRNTHYRLLNLAKVQYKDWMKEQIDKAQPREKVLCVYKVYHPTRRYYDVGNVCCVHEKFFEDAFVELGKLPDDNKDYIPLVIYMRGGVDKENPRVEIEVIDFNEEGIHKVYEMMRGLLEEED